MLNSYRTPMTIYVRPEIKEALQKLKSKVGISIQRMVEDALLQNPKIKTEIEQLIKNKKNKKF